MKKLFPRVWKIGRDILTRNKVPGYRSHSEKLVKVGKAEYRIWDPNRSKPAAALSKGLKNFPVKAGSKILYLGAASGSTASFFSDIVGEDGVVYAVEFSERSIRDLNFVAGKRRNIIPILADARKPEAYGWVEPVDIIYEDVASDDQALIMVRNAEKFLKPGGFALMAIKARSIDVTREPEEVYKEELKLLSKHFKIVEEKELKPFEKDHLFVVMKPGA